MGKLKGSTLVEVIIALVILVTIFSLAFTVFIQMNKNNNNLLKIKASVITNNKILELENESELFSDIEEIETFKVTSNVIELDKKNLYEISVTVKRDSVLYASEKKIIEFENYDSEY